MNTYFIGKDYIDKCRIMRDIVLQTFPMSPNRDHYINILNVLLGDDIDLTDFIVVHPHGDLHNYIDPI